MDVCKAQGDLAMKHAGELVEVAPLIAQTDVGLEKQLPSRFCFSFSLSPAHGVAV